jgi:cyclic beta-1,2-glucan synthetase
LGSAASSECRIDSIAQSWGVISGAADAQRARRAMAAMDQNLVRPDAGLVLLFTPPFDHSAADPGYIKGYPPGVRENGGQYTHAAIWSVIAFAMLGDADKAVELYSILNTINHARTHAEPPHVGRGGWTWYTGSAAWLYRAGLEWLLGCRVRGESLLLDPCVPRGWPGFEISFRYRSAHYEITVKNTAGVNRGITSLQLDGLALGPQPALVPLVDDGASHRVRAVIG